MIQVEGVECPGCNSLVALDDLLLEKNGTRTCPHCGATVLDENGEKP